MRAQLSICGPIALTPLRDWLDEDPASVPRGLGSSPMADLAHAALESGLHVDVVTLDPEVREERILRGHHLTVYVGPFRARHRARDLFRQERDYLRDVIRRAKPEVVHAHWTYEYALGALESGAPTVVTAHDSPLRVLRLDPTPYRCVRTWMAWQTARRARHLTAVSADVAEHFRRYFRYQAPIAVVPNGIPEEWFTDSPGGSPTASRIGYAGVLNGWGDLKNGKTLLQAFRLVRQSMPESQLSLFGFGHGAGEEAEAWARSQGLAENVRFRGLLERPALRDELKLRTQIMVHPSREESFGMSIAEAMALGIPVIAGAASGAVASTLDNGRCGILTDVDSPGAMAADMLRLAGDPQLRGRLAVAGAESARRKYRMQNVLAAYDAIYREAKKS